MEFRILGPVEVVDGDRRIPLGGRKRRALLAMLILRRQQVVSVDELIEALWGDDPPKTAEHSVQVYVSELRKALGGMGEDGKVVVARHDPGYALDVPPSAIDLDRFGQINKDPQYGAHIGDEVLAEIGSRLRSQARTGDAVARPGGDEFAGFFAGSFDPESAIRLGERLENEIRRPGVTSQGIIEVGASIGLVIAVPGPDLPDIASLMRMADKTMQAVKRDGGGVRLYEPDSDDGDGPV